MALSLRTFPGQQRPKANRGRALSASLTTTMAAAMAVSLGAPLSTAQAQGKPASLGALLDQIEEDVQEGAKEQQLRLQEFERKKAEQAALLEEARAQEKALEAKSAALERQFEENDGRIKEHQQLLKERMGSLGELFGVVRQVSGDTGALIDASVVSAQIPGRREFLAKLGQSKALPSIKELEKLWYSLQQEMTEQGRVVRFTAKVTDAAGDSRNAAVVRVGTFNLVSGGKYLSYGPESGLIELSRQPEDRYTALIGDLESASAGHITFGIDPSRGSLLGLLVQTPGLAERLEAGGVVGKIIMYLGGLTAVLALIRLAMLLIVAAKIRSQERTPTQSNKGNPLGRVLAVYHERRDADVETIERKLDEAVLREASALERFLWAVKVVAVVAPLMGLLGTVTGMIRTFQAITLFGAGDPKLMAGGISEALVTTMLGLYAAIPLVLLHSVLKSTTRRMIDVLQEQAAGLIAVQAESVSMPPGRSPSSATTPPTPSTSPAFSPGGE